MFPSHSRDSVETQLAVQTAKTAKLGLLFLHFLIKSSQYENWLAYILFCSPRNRTQTSSVKLCCANHQTTNVGPGRLSHNSQYLILNPWSATLLTFHFHTLFVPKFNTNSLEYDQLPKEPKPHSPHLNKASKYPPLVQSSEGAPHAVNHTTCYPSLPKQIWQIHDPGLFQSGCSQSNHHKRDSQITRSKICYSLIEPQPSPCKTISMLLRLRIPCTCSPPTPNIHSSSSQIRRCTALNPPP